MKKMLMFNKVFILMAGSEALHEWHPENEAANIVCKLVGKSRLDDKQIEFLRELGFSIYVVEKNENC